MGYFFKELYHVFSLFSVGFTLAYMLASYHGLDTNLTMLWGGF